MQRIDECVLGALQIIEIVALNGLIQERKPEQQDKAKNQPDLRVLG